MNTISFYGSEGTGSIGNRIPENPNKENTSPNYRYNYASNSTLNTLDKDTVCFRGKEQEKESSFLGTLAKIGIGAAAIVAGLGCAKKYKWVDKIPDGTFKDYLTKYGTDPCHKACKYVKDTSIDWYNKVADMFKNKGK